MPRLATGIRTDPQAASESRAIRPQLVYASQCGPMHRRFTPIARDSTLSARGFTLIEVVVVLFIIGILASILSLSISNRPVSEQQRTEGQRLEKLLQLAADQAQLQSTQIGLLVGQRRYRFVHLDDKRRWVPYASGPLRPRKLPEPFEFRLHVERHAISAQQLSRPNRHGDDGDDSIFGQDGDGDTTKNDSSDQKKKPPPPQILLLSSGETTAFRLDIIVPGSSDAYRVSSNALGQIKLERITLQ